MKSDDIKKLFTQSVSELQKTVDQLQKEIMDLRMQKTLNKNKNVREYKNKRQTLSRVKTLLRNKEIESQTKKVSK